ncbi:Ribonuclease PH [hydrothermal vent metagenome]|uniref:Ribonuclease PH n=1 Tax=hydrothermal vent metagenome TaxID=652676 RepID=A0A3B1CLD5_9ZZZZ
MDKRGDGRAHDQRRPTKIERGVNIHAEGSALIETGDTKVLCLATVTEGVPFFLRDTGKGWVTGEYSMIPRATVDRTNRERRGAGGRTMEIQRLIGRSLRAIVNLPLLGERTITIDCDVLQADGGTRTAAITGAFVVMYDAMRALVDKEIIASMPINEFVAATSVGIVDGKAALDLNYEEDSSADVDMNVVMTGSGNFIEVQGTAEKTPFSKDTLDNLLALATKGINEIFTIQKQALGVTE